MDGASGERATDAAFGWRIAFSTAVRCFGKSLITKGLLWVQIGTAFAHASSSARERRPDAIRMVAIPMDA